jgi:hypothetical protein
MSLIDPNLNGLVSSAALAIMPVSAIPETLSKASSYPDCADAFMQHYYVFDSVGNEVFALEMQLKALAHRRHFRAENPENPTVRLLALMAPGGRMVNTPLEFIAHGNHIRLDQWFVVPGEPVSEDIPDHDIAILAYSDAEDAQSLLPLFESLASDWPRPLLNHPAKIQRCTRDALCQALEDVPGLVVPRTVRVTREDLLAAFPLPFPAIIRPVGTHAGTGLEKLSDLTELAVYLATYPESAFFVSEYFDYRGDDGHFRKLRVALIEGVPYVCHVAIGDDWVVHYQTAGMDQAEWKRNEEEQVMKSFDDSFARRHKDAFAAITAHLELDYVVLDCAELVDGRFLLFEADTGGWVHATDSPDVFPYKPPIMQKLFTAFRDMLVSRCVQSVEVLA